MRLSDCWTVEAVADHTGYHPEYVRERARQGSIPSAFRFGGRWAFDPGTIRKWWAAGAPKANARLFD